MALELVTFADLEKLLGLTDAAITDYPALEVINDTMIVAFETELGRKLNSESRTDTQYVGKFKKSMLNLPAIPITTMTSVTVTQLGDSESWTEDEDYEVTGYGIRLLTGITNSKIVTVYTGGLSAVSEEPGLNRAALYQIAYEFQSKDWIGAESVSTEGGNVTRPELTLLKETKRMLKGSIHPLHTGHS